MEDASADLVHRFVPTGDGHFEASGTGYGDRGPAAPASGLGAELLSVEEAVRRYGALGGAGTQTAESRERQAQEAGRELSLDKVMLQDVMQKSSEACQETRDRELLNG